MTEKVGGTLEISNAVLADIVGYAALECYGVVGMTSASPLDTFLGILPITRLKRGVNVFVKDDVVNVEVFVVVEYGTNITAVSENLRERIEFVLKKFAGVERVEVSVFVKDVNVR